MVWVLSNFGNWSWVMADNWWYYFGNWSWVMGNWSRVVSNWSGSIVSYWSNNFGNWLNNFMAGWFTVNNSIETIVVIGCVFNYTVMTIGIQKAVWSMDSISITGFVLAFDISGMFIMNRVGEIVFGWSFIFNLFVNWSSNCFYNWCSMVNWSSLVMLSWLMMFVSMVLSTGNSYKSSKGEEL